MNASEFHENIQEPVTEEVTLRESSEGRHVMLIIGWSNISKHIM